MLSYKNDLSTMEQTKLDTLIDGVDMANKVYKDYNVILKIEEC